MGGTVGFVANPVAGKDIRRIVAHAAPVSDAAKVGILRRALVGAAEGGAVRLVVAPDAKGLADRAVAGVALPEGATAMVLAGRPAGGPSDTVAAVRVLHEAGADVVVALGGDGTCRDVVSGWADVVLVPLSTGTNNVFPLTTEPTVAGRAAGLVAAGIVATEAATWPAKVLHLSIEGLPPDLALVEVALLAGRLTGSRAVWEPDAVRAVVAAIAEPTAVGLSAIPAAVAPVDRRTAGAVLARVGAGPLTVRVPLVPGRFATVAGVAVSCLAEGEPVVLEGPGVLALDGERQHVLEPGQRATVVVRRSGPRVVDVARTLALATPTPLTEEVAVPTAFAMPKLGLTMTEGTILEWLVDDGTAVAAGTPVLRIETDKVETEVEVPDAGVLVHVGEVGSTFGCGVTVGWLLGPGEPRPTAAPAANGTAGPAAASTRRFVSPNARRVGRALGVDPESLTGTGPGGRVVSEDVEAAAAAAVAPAAQPAPARRSDDDGRPGGPVRLVTHAARHLAVGLGLDPAAVTGTGPDGRITRADVLADARARLATGASAVPRPGGAAAGPQPGDVVPLTGARGLIARRMVESLHDMAQLTLTVDADVDRVLDLRRQLAEIGAEELGAVPTITDFVIAATARALRRHPIVNSRIVGDRIEVLADVHVGVAVAADRGLVVPVVRHADSLALADLAAATRELAAHARAGTLTLADLEGGTCSVTNLGMFGVDMFTPVVNPPNAAIVGVGRVRDDTAWDGDRPRKVARATLSVTWDHRVLDGAPAAAFARTIVELLAQPVRLLEERG